MLMKYVPIICAYIILCLAFISSSMRGIGLKKELVSAQLDIQELKKHEEILYNAYRTLDFQIDVLVGKDLK